MQPRRASLRTELQASRSASCRQVKKKLLSIQFHRSTLYQPSHQLAVAHPQPPLRTLEVQCVPSSPASAPQGHQWQEMHLHRPSHLTDVLASSSRIHSHHAGRQAAATFPHHRKAPVVGMVSVVVRKRNWGRSARGFLSEFERTEQGATCVSLVQSASLS